MDIFIHLGEEALEEKPWQDWEPVLQLLQSSLQELWRHQAHHSQWESCSQGICKVLKMCGCSLPKVMSNPAGCKIFYWIYLQQKLLWFRKSYPERQPAWPDLWNGLSNIRLVCWRLQPGCFWRRSYQHWRLATFCCRNVQEDEDSSGIGNWKLEVSFQ